MSSKVGVTNALSRLFLVKQKSQLAWLLFSLVDILGFEGDELILQFVNKQLGGFDLV